MIDPKFRNINRLFVLSLKNGDNDPTRGSFAKYYMPLVEIKDFNALIDKYFFDQPVKKQTTVWKTYWNFKKWWLYNMEFTRFLISSELL